MVARVLFLSSNNSVRSQMAEGFLRALGDDAFEAYSAGSVPRKLHPLALAVMAERGIDISGQRPKGFQHYLGTAQFEHLITVCDRAEKECPMFPGKGTREFWPVEDPSGHEERAEDLLPKFRAARDDIEAHVRRFLVERRYKRVVELSGRGALV